MDVAYLYTKTRSEFGKHCGFEDVPARVLKTIPSTCAARLATRVAAPSCADGLPCACARAHTCKHWHCPFHSQ